jgi:hypothetical protein
MSRNCEDHPAGWSGCHGSVGRLADEAHLSCGEAPPDSAGTSESEGTTSAGLVVGAEVARPPLESLAGSTEGWDETF